MIQLNDIAIVTISVARNWVGKIVQLAMYCVLDIILKAISSTPIFNTVGKIMQEAILQMIVIISLDL